MSVSITWWTLVRVIALALVLLMFVRGLRWSLAIAPISSARRATLQHALPVVELFLSAFYMVAAVQFVFASDATVSAAAVLGVVFGALWLARQPLTDLMLGVIVRSGGNVNVGDRIALDELEGRVVRMGPRVVAVRLWSGEEALIPYSRLGRDSVVRIPAVDGAHRHAFRIDAAEGRTAEEVQRLALLCHWSSPAREPSVELRDDGSLEVAVFALEAGRGREVERFVRERL